MGWQQRGSRSYFYLSRRVGKGFTCAYMGAGVAAQLAASLLLKHQADRQEARQQRRLALDREQRASAALRQFMDFTTLLARATLLVEGFHRHDRGQWRRRRDSNGKCDRSR